MGVLYTVFPLETEIRTYLGSLGVALPPENTPSRNPTPLEVRSVVRSLPGISAEVDETPEGRLLQVTLTAPDPDNGPWTLLNIDSYHDEASPCGVWFEKGWPELILEVLIRVTSFTGPLVLVPDTGEEPIVVSASDTVPSLVNVWEHTRPMEPEGSPGGGAA